MQFSASPKRGGNEVRCPTCGALLGIRDAGGLSIKRGDTQVTINGMFQVSIVCWRHTCGKLTVLQVDTTEVFRRVTAG